MELNGMRKRHKSLKEKYPRESTVPLSAETSRRFTGNQTGIGSSLTPFISVGENLVEAAVSSSLSVPSDKKTPLLIKDDCQVLSVQSSAVRHNTQKYITAVKKDSGELFRKSGHTKSGKGVRKWDKKFKPYGVGMMVGAPRMREILTLSPDKHKGKIWVPLSNDSADFCSTITQMRTSDFSEAVYGSPKDCCSGESSSGQMQKLQQTVLSSSREKTGNNFTLNSACESERLQNHVGSQSSSTHWAHFTPHELFSYSGSYDKSSILNNHKYLMKQNPQQLANVELGDKINSGSQIEGSGGLEFRDRKLLSGQEKSHYSNCLQAVSYHESDRRIHSLVGHEKPKLSKYTRRVYKVDSGLGFARDRRDKTPYIKKQLNPLWQAKLQPETPGGSSSKSSKTPTDVTPEKCTEDPLSSQSGSENYESQVNVKDMTFSGQAAEQMRTSGHCTQSSIENADSIHFQHNYQTGGCTNATSESNHSQSNYSNALCTNVEDNCSSSNMQREEMQVLPVVQSNQKYKAVPSEQVYKGEHTDMQVAQVNEAVTELEHLHVRELPAYQVDYQNVSKEIYDSYLSRHMIHNAGDKAKPHSLIKGIVVSQKSSIAALKEVAVEELT